MLGDVNVHGDPEPAAHRRSRERVVAGRSHDDAAGCLLRSQQEKLGGRATELERTGFLQVLELQEDPSTRAIAKRVRLGQRRFANVCPD